MTLLVDCHAHLGMSDDPGLAVSEARERGVGHIIAVGFDLKTSRQAVDIARRHAGVSAAVGMHPHDASSLDSRTIAELKSLAAAPEVVAIGETGLDYYRDRSPRDRQQEAFKRQIGLAHETGQTLMVHSREAPDDTMAILETEASGLRVMLHCFPLYGQVDECAARGYYMSIAGNVTFPKATALRESVRKIPANLLLTETDSPWLTPVPFRGKTNQPAYIRFIIAELSLLRQTSPDDLIRQVHANFCAAFAIR
ncbi:MAG: TatD family hydrolase [Thermoleophilia bacterium]|nr:TatD family hydrolase [Thermoleophilia bacterium]